jgi:DNA-binding transcriptional MerR regulator
MTPEEKIYYTIGEVAAMFNVAPSLIRFWEKEFDELKPRKTSGGTRKFNREDIETIKTIHFLVKEQGYTLAGAREKMKTDRLKIKDKAEIVERLQKIKHFLTGLKKQIRD